MYTHLLLLYPFDISFRYRLKAYRVGIWLLRQASAHTCHWLDYHQRVHRAPQEGSVSAQRTSGTMVLSVEGFSL